MAILDIGGKSVVNANRLRGYKGEGERKGRMPARDHAMSHSGGFLDFWLKPLLASKYDYEATERKTGISAGHMRRVVAVMSRMEYEAEKTCTAERKESVRKALTGSVKARGLNAISQGEIARVYEGTVVRNLPAREVAREMGITMARLQTVRSLAKSRGQWPSEGKAVAS